MSGPELEQWHTREFHLSFFLGDLCFYTRRFQAMIRQRPFDPNVQAEEPPPPPFESFPPGVDAVFYRRTPIKAPLPPILAENRWIRYAPRQLDHYYTDMRGTFEDYLKKFTKKTRSELRRQLKVFAQFSEGRLDFRIYKTPEEMEEFHPAARALAKNTYQEKLFQGALPDTERFKEQMRRLAEQDQVRGFLLYHHGVPIAYLYTPGPLGYIDYAFLGYDPDYKQWSPGTLLQYLALEKLFEERRFKFYYWGYGEGQAKSKVFFSTGTLLCADIYYFRPTLQNVLVVNLHRATAVISKSTGQALERLGLRRRFKQLLRSSPVARSFAGREGSTDAKNLV